MMPGRRVPGRQSRGSVTSTQNLMPSRGRVTCMRLCCAPVTSGATSLLLRELACFVPAFASRRYASGIIVGDSCV